MQKFEIDNDILVRYHGSEETVSIPENVTKIKWGAFSGCTALKSIILPEGITDLGYTITALDDLPGAFENCTALQYISLPESLVFIGQNTFKGCENLMHLTLPNNIHEIDETAFIDCPGLKLHYLRYTFSPSSDIYLFQILYMLRIKDFSRITNNPVKAQLLFTLYFSYPDGEELFIYLQEHFIELFKVLTNGRSADTASKILNSGQFVTNQNINELIQYAIEQKAYDIQVILTDYKYQHFDSFGKEWKL